MVAAAEKTKPAKRTRVRRLSLSLLVVQLVCLVILGALTAFLVRKAVFPDPVPTPTPFLAQIHISDLQPDETVETFIMQETAVGDELSLAFGFRTDRRPDRKGSPLSVEVTFSGSDRMDIRCLEPDNSYRELGAVGKDQLSAEAGRRIEVLQWQKHKDPIQGPYEQSELQDRDAFWSRINVYRFTTKTAYSPLNLFELQGQLEAAGIPDTDVATLQKLWTGTSRNTIDNDREMSGPRLPGELSYPSGFYCIVSPRTAWRQSSGRDSQSFAPAQVATVPQGPGIPQLYDPVSLASKTRIKRDLNSIPTQKPDSATATSARWEYTSPVDSYPTGAVGGTDYFVFENANKASRDTQYSFALGIAVSTVVTLLTAIFGNVFRAVTGRAAYYHLADED